MKTKLKTKMLILSSKKPIFLHILCSKIIDSSKFFFHALKTQRKFNKRIKHKENSTDA